MVPANRKHDYDVWLNTLNNILYASGRRTPVEPTDGGAQFDFCTDCTPQQSAEQFLRMARLAEP